MSARLWLASIWMPRYMMAREIERIRSSTDVALDALLSEHAPEIRNEGRDGPYRQLEEQRAAMARGHERKVRALVQALGQEKAIGLGREALFRTGLALGKEAKARLGVRDTKKDLFRAAKLLYRILGIEFSIMTGPDGERMEVFRCPLSRYYSQDTCKILSAVDEGTFSGLNNRVVMHFQEKITDGSPKCVARIQFREG